MPGANTQQALPSEPTRDTPDSVLILWAADGNTRSFEFIMRRHNQLLFRTARSMVRSDADAEDVVQDAYLQAWRALSGFRGDAKLSTWLVRIVINAALTRKRRKSAELIPWDIAVQNCWSDIQAAMGDAIDQRPDQAAMRAELRATIEKHIDLLPDKYRTVFVLRAVQELSVTEVSEALGIPEATVRTHYFRARKLLRVSLSADIDVAVKEAFLFGGEQCNRIVRRVLDGVS